MAASSKFDLSSGNPDKPLYSSGQRGSLTASMDRSGSFRESMENPILSSLPSMSRNSSAVTQGEVINFFQCLNLDPKTMATEHKFHRQGDFKRLISVGLGIQPDESPSGSSKSKLISSPSPDELKRAKSNLREGSNRARDRINRFNEAISACNKFFPSIPSRKRSRLDGLSSERSNALLSGDRSVLGPGIGKMITQGHTITSGFEQEQQKSEERTKSSVPNKRTRTSLVDMKMDVRNNALARPSGSVDKDREILRLGNSGAVLGEDRIPSIGVDGWEKTKMKKKRSGIKPDVSPNTVPTKAVDGYRESKQGMQQKVVADARSRLSESHGFRPGIANGAGKAESSPQQSSVGIRASIPRADQDNGSSLSDRRDRPIGSDKERVNLRVVNKTNVRDDFGSASPTSSPKLNPSVRGPRSGSGVVTKLSPVVSRPTVSNDWELSHCTNKLPAAVGAANRKRTSSTRSSSPPVAHWATQRPQKISRTARRSNFVPIVSTNDDVPSLDSMSDVAAVENGTGFARRLHSDSPQQVKLKVDHFSSAALSESEESATAEIKSRDKSKKSDEIDEKTGQNVQKVSTPVMSARKNKLVSGEDLGDGVRRQGRTGRGFTSARALMPMTVEKHGSVGTAKQLRSTRVGFDKSESKAGRPPTRKLSDRKAYTRQKHTTVNATADFLDDGNEELLAAARAVLNPNHALSSTFWREVEIYFCSISDPDIAYLKQQENLASLVQIPNPVPLDVDGCITASNGFKRKGDVGCTIKTKSVEPFPEQFSPENMDHSEITLCQRLISALIPEEGSEDFSCNGSEDLIYGTGFELDEEFRSSSFNHQLLGNFQTNDYRITSSGASLDKQGVDTPESDIRTILNTGSTSHLGYSQNGILVDQALMPSLACSEFEYENMSLDKKILLEIQSVGIFPEVLPDMTPSDDEEILEGIHRLEDTYHRQVSEKMGLVDNLMKSASERKELQEKEFEQHALDKLVGMAYEKYTTCCGMKSSSSKMAKQAALAFVKRTLERCQKFEDTGTSCFSEPSFREKLLSLSSRLNDSESADTVTEGELARLYASTSNYALDARTSVPISTQKSPSLTSRFGQNIDNLDIYSSDVLRPANLSNEQTTGKEDMWSNRVKKRELLLDDVGGTSSAPSGMGNSLSSSTKGKRSERDREGKGHSREVLSRNGTTKIGRPSLSNARGERKSKSKSKHRTTQLSSVNGPLGKLSDPPQPAIPSIPKSSEMRTSGNSKETDEFGLEDPIDLSGLQLPGMDVLGGDDLGEQGQDIGSWLNIDDDGLQDHDFMGLEIPMDDLTDLNMMV